MRSRINWLKSLWLWVLDLSSSTHTLYKDFPGLRKSVPVVFVQFCNSAVPEERMRFIYFYTIFANIYGEVSWNVCGGVSTTTKSDRAKLKRLKCGFGQVLTLLSASTSTLRRCFAFFLFTGQNRSEAETKWNWHMAIAACVGVVVDVDVNVGVTSGIWNIWIWNRDRADSCACVRVLVATLHCLGHNLCCHSTCFCHRCAVTLWWRICNQHLCFWRCCHGNADADAGSDAHANAHTHTHIRRQQQQQHKGSDAWNTLTNWIIVNGDTYVIYRDAHFQPKAYNRKWVN